MSIEQRTEAIGRSSTLPLRRVASSPQPPSVHAWDTPAPPRAGGYGQTAAEGRLVADLRAGDEAAFMSVLDEFGATMLRVARLYVPSASEAEEVVQETWLAVLEGLSRFEERCSFRTWVFRILTNIARKRGPSVRRTLPFSQFAKAELGSVAGQVDPGRFVGDDDPEWVGHWTSIVSNWDERGEWHLLSEETLACVGRAMEDLPPLQGAVMRLRDVEGWTSEEVSVVLRISRGNERVLLHRARGRVRSAMEAYLDG